MIKLGVSGAMGKMGKRILSLALLDRVFKVSLALEKTGCFLPNKKIAGLKVQGCAEAIKSVDVLIDFSCIEATLEHLAYAVKFKKAIVIGTTGFSEAQKKKIVLAAKKIPVIFSPNMSIGVNLLFSLVQQAANVLSKEYKASIVEAHHVHKKDAPSGTAKYLAQIIKEECKHKPGVKSIREGEIIGDHDVIFDSPWDTIKLSHSAKTRDIFAKGALEAAKFIVTRKKGLYGMDRVIRR
ncbi:MAG: 4-hydroxy-tetrahydrodipicolinate reductase [Candidatus Omnitrophota bacterium]